MGQAAREVPTSSSGGGAPHAVHLPPGTVPARLEAWRRAGWKVFPLVRRGARLGFVAEKGARRGPDRAETKHLWTQARPLLLPGFLRGALARRRRAVRRTLALFRRLGNGADFASELSRRLPPGAPFRQGGASVDLGDGREIEKVHFDAVRHGRAPARDLYAKLSLVSADARDPSLRIRFSFGAERLSEWRRSPARAEAADVLAEALFPECAVLAGPEVLGLLAELAGRRVRLSERILYCNQPGGGAAFHHDAEPGQLGVAYAQLSGSTAWLALPRTHLAGEVAAAARGGALRPMAGTPHRALRALERQSHDPALRRLLDRSPRLAARLVARGAFHRLRPGDLLLLPSRPDGEAAWHSVFTLGGRPALSLSFGVFRSTGKKAGT